MVGRGGCLGRSSRLFEFPVFPTRFITRPSLSIGVASFRYTYIYIYLEEEIRIPRDSWEKTEGEEEVVISLGFSVAFTPASHCSRPSTRHCATIGDWGCTIDAGCIHADSS